MSQNNRTYVFSTLCMHIIIESLKRWEDKIVLFTINLICVAHSWSLLNLFTCFYSVTLYTMSCLEYETVSVFTSINGCFCLSQKYQIKSFCNDFIWYLILPLPHYFYLFCICKDISFSVQSTLQELLNLQRMYFLKIQRLKLGWNYCKSLFFMS